MPRAPKVREGVDFALVVPAPLDFEEAFWAANGPAARLAGVDEAGRGPLAGPVAAGAVCMPPTLARDLRAGPLAALTDSKKLSEAQRAELYAAITGTPGVDWALGLASPAEIDRLNILRATHLAMRRALEGLRGGVPAKALVDGLPARDLPCPQEAVVKGDARSFLIAAASIVAKVSRDRILDELDAAHPGYGFAENKGYPTPAHLEALRRLGVSPCHRRSFGPVDAILNPGLFDA